MEKVLVSGRIEYIREAISLLVFYASGGMYSSNRKDYERKNAKKSERVIEKYHLLQKIEDDFGKAIKPYEEDLQYYFGKKYSEGRNPGHVVLCANELENKFEDIHSIREYWNQLNEADYNSEYAQQLYEYNSIVYDYEEEGSKDIQAIDIIKNIMEMDIPDADKWKLQNIYFYPEEHREKVLRLISISYDVIKKYENDLRILQKEFIYYWKKVTSEGDIYKYIEEYLGITLDENKFGCELVLNIFTPNGITIHASSEGDIVTSKYKITMGILFDDEYLPTVANDEKANQEDILNALKLLADKSKFDILIYIKDKKAYGGELAKKFDLTPATISHHMSALLSAGLVKIEKEDTKVYYIANRDEIEKVVRAVDSYLL